MLAMNLIWRRAGRQIWAIRYRLLAIALIAASAFAIYSGIYSAMNSLFASRDHYYQEGNMADLELRFVPDDLANIPSLAGLPGIRSVEHRLLSPASLTLNDGKRLAGTLIGLDLAQPLQINRLTLLEGKALDPARPDEVIIDRNLARYHGLQVGDTLDMALGNDNYHLRVRGIARSPEFLLASANPNFFLPSKGSMGIIYGSLELIASRLGFPLVNSLLFDLRQGPDAAPVLGQRIADALGKRLNIEEILPLKRQFSYLFMQTDLNAFAIFVPAVIIIFSLAAITITFFLLLQWIMGQRQEIGLLKAIGYGKQRLVLAYSFPLLVITAVAIIAGFGLSFLVLMEFGHSYSEAVGFPKPLLQLEGAKLLLGLLGMVLGLALAAFWPQRRLLGMSPQDAVRPARGGSSGQLGVARAVARWVGGRILLKYPLRSLLRNKGVTLMTVLAITMAMGVSLSYFIATTSFKDSIVSRFADDRWDLSVEFLTPLWNDELQQMLTPIGGIQKRDPYVRGGIRIAHAGQQKSSLLGSLNPDTNLRHIDLLQGSLPTAQRDGIVLERKLAASLGAQVGDPLQIESQGHHFDTVLLGIFSGALPGESYTSLRQARRWLDYDTQLNGVFLQVAGNPQALAQQLRELPRVAQVTRKDLLAEQVVKVSEEALTIIYISAAFSIAVTLLFLFASATFTVLQRKSEYVVLRILGFCETSINLMILLEILGVGLLASLLAVPSGYVIAHFLVGRLSDAWFSVTTSMSTTDVAIIIAPVLVLLPLSAWPVMRLVQRASLPKTLRERMFG